MKKITYTPTTRGTILSKRQLDVFLLFCRGYSMKEIAGELGITVWTARCHGKKIYKKLNIHRRSDARGMAQDLEALRRAMLAMFGFVA